MPTIERNGISNPNSKARPTRIMFPNPTWTLVAVWLLSTDSYQVHNIFGPPHSHRDGALFLLTGNFLGLFLTPDAPHARLQEASGRGCAEAAAVVCLVGRVDGLVVLLGRLLDGLPRFAHAGCGSLAGR